MNNYLEIITKIIKVIDASKNSYDTKKICFFDIDSRFLEEFDRLIEVESVYYELTHNREIINNNIKLKFELFKIKNELNTKLVEQLIRIINNTSGQIPENLVLVGDYIIVKEDELQFVYLTKQLHVGPFKPKNKIESQDEIRIKNIMTRSKAQFERINASLSEPLIEADSSFIKSEFDIIIKLIIQGIISKENIAKIRNIYRENEYLELLNDLRKYHILTAVEYEQLRDVDVILSYDSTVSELVDFFKKIPDLDLETVDSFRAVAGNYCVNEAIMVLVENGTFEMSEYMQFVASKKESEIEFLK